MKKILTLIMTVLLLTACGDIDSDSSSNSDSTITEENSRIRFSQLEREDYTITGTCLTSDEKNIYECETKVTDEQSAEKIWEYLCQLTDREPYAQGKADLKNDYYIHNTLTIKEISGDNFYTVEIGTYMIEYPETDDIETYDYTTEHQDAVFIRQNNTGDYYCYDRMPEEALTYGELVEILERSTEDNHVYLDITKLPDPSLGPKDLIILVDMYSNYAWEPVNRGKYLDNNGYIYEFDFSDINVFDSDFDFTSSLYDHYENNAPVGSIDEETLRSVIDCTFDIYPQEFEKEVMMFDAGQNSILIIDWTNSDLALFEISTEGDWTGQIDNEKVDEIIGLWNGAEISAE